jgi:RimJ/RimL family protein N-acetyltransferase
LGEKLFVATPPVFDIGPTLPVLRGQRTIVRPLGQADVPALFGIFSHPEVVRYWDRPPFPDLAAAEELLRKIEEGIRTRTLFQWGIARLADGVLLGTCTLAHLNAPHRRGEIGYALGRPYWRQGYAAEAVPVVLRFAFEKLGLHRIEADVDPRNAASLRLLGRLGFRREGYLRERYQGVGELQDAVILGLLRPEAAWL